MSDYDLFEFRHLKFFAAIAEEGNLTVAANRLNTCQSNLSTQIKQLESICNTELLHRDHDGVSLTPSGHVLLAGAYEALQLRIDLVDILRAIGVATVEPVRLGFSSLVEQRLLSTLCDEIQTLLPGSEVKTVGDSLESLEQRVRDGDLHGALVTLPLVEGADITSVIVDRESFVVCLRNDDPLAIHESLPTHALSGKLAVFEYPALHTHAHKRLLELLQEVGITPLELHPTVNFDHVQWMVMQKECYALIRSKKSLMPGLTTRPIHGVNWTVDTVIIAPPVMQHPAVTVLMREKRRPLQRVPSLHKAVSAHTPNRNSTTKRNRGRKASLSSMPLFKPE